jgi:sugar phosphate isomerase/epimerase
LRIALEFMPMSSLRSLPDAMAVIGEVGLPNVGLLVDTLHLARSQGGAAGLAVTDPARIFLTQICDAPAQLAPGSTLYDEAMSGRLYPGDGALDLAGYLRALPADCEIECETPALSDAHLPLAERARRTAAKARYFYERHFGA